MSIAWWCIHGECKAPKATIALYYSNPANEYMSWPPGDLEMLTPGVGGGGLPSYAYHTQRISQRKYPYLGSVPFGPSTLGVYYNKGWWGGVRLGIGYSHWITLSGGYHNYLCLWGLTLVSKYVIIVE